MDRFVAEPPRDDVVRTPVIARTYLGPWRSMHMHRWTGQVPQFCSFTARKPAMRNIGEAGRDALVIKLLATNTSGCLPESDRQ